MSRTTIAVLSALLLTASVDGAPVGASPAVAAPGAVTLQGVEALQGLAAEFWRWRAATQPVSGDDIPRLERPHGWVPDWSPRSVAARREALDGFRERLASIGTDGWSVHDRVDRLLLESALARVEWELDVTAGWRRNPLFYVDETLTSIFDELLQPPPFDAVRSEGIARRFEAIPATVQAARANLDEPIGPFAELAVNSLEGVRERLATVAAELAPHLESVDAARLTAAADAAASALETWRAELESAIPSMPRETAVGRDAYEFFLRRVALMPFTPERLVQMSRQEWERAVAFESIERARASGMEPLPLAVDVAAQAERNARDEAQVRRFLEDNGILSVPSSTRHYTNAAVPTYLRPLAGQGVTDDLTSASRLDEDGVKYVPEPSPDTGYFNVATARDSRPILVHEGVPGHYFQLVRSWGNADPIRRHYYDSGANEGIGFYAEEMMLQAGYFGDDPRVRQVIYNFARLRALRVEVDVKLATGQFDIPQAADYLERTVPMDAGTALEEAAFFASTPGQAISYQIGKLQILTFLSEARMQRGDAFDLRDFHDFVWTNGNVPIALQRWEYLGLDDEIRQLTGAAESGPSASAGAASEAPPRPAQVEVGELPPSDFRLDSLGGERFALAEARGDRPLLLLFFRGAW